MRRGGKLSVTALMCLGVAGCGLTNPDIKEIWDVDFPENPKTGAPPVSAAAQIEFEIKKKIFCELKSAVYHANHYPVYESDTLNGPRIVKYRSLIPDKWGAQIALSLTVDESSALNPGVALNQVLPTANTIFGPQNSVPTMQSFSLGFGGTLSSTATRIDKFNPYYSIAYLSKPPSKDLVCNQGKDPFEQQHQVPARSSPFLIESDLGIEKWLMGAMFATDLLPSRGAPTTPGGSAPKPDTVSYEIKFVIVSNGNVTPTWKLVQVSANTGSQPLFAAGRTRTHDLIITIGPEGTATSNAHLASQIGAAVNSGNKAPSAAP